MIPALMELMNTCYHCGDFDQLGAVARTLLNAVPDDIVSAHFLALAYIKTGRPRDASSLFERLRRRMQTLSRRPRSERGAVQPAREVCLSVATERDPEYASTWLSLALDLEQAGRGHEAIAMLRLAVAARPRDAAALGELGRIGLALGDLDAAQEGHAGLLALCPDNAEALRGMEAVLALRLLKRQT